MSLRTNILSDKEEALKNVTAELLDDAPVQPGVLSSNAPSASGVLNASLSAELIRDGSLLHDSALLRLMGNNSSELRDLSASTRRELEAYAAAFEEIEDSDGQAYVRSSYLKSAIARAAQGLAFINVAGSAADGSNKDIEDTLQEKAQRKLNSTMRGQTARKKEARQALRNKLRREKTKRKTVKRTAQRIARRAAASHATHTAASSGAKGAASVVSTPIKGVAASGSAVVLITAVLAAFLLSVVAGASVASSAYESTITRLDTFSVSERQVASYLFNKGFDDVHVAAIMANMRAESGGSPGDDFNTGAVELITGAGHGICQWTGSRWLNLLNYSIAQGLPWTDLSLQLDFFWSEYEGFADSYTRTYTVNSTSTDPAYPAVVSGSKIGFIEATDVATATKEFCYFFEGPGIPHESLRISYAEIYLSWLRNESALASGWVFPLPDGWTLSSDYGERSSGMHYGVDFAISSGTPIYAACGGTVMYAGWYGTGGYTVIIDHGGSVVSLYEHMSSTAATLGSYVLAGEVIGYVGSTGNATGPHLHFEIQVNGTSVDPSGYITY